MHPLVLIVAVSSLLLVSSSPSSLLPVSVTIGLEHDAAKINFEDHQRDYHLLNNRDGSLEFHAHNTSVFRIKVRKVKATAQGKLRGKRLHAGNSKAYVPVMHVPRVFNASNTLIVENSYIKVTGVRQWSVVAFDDFDDASSNGWHPDVRSTCGLARDSFLGGYCKLSHHEASKTFSNLPPHRRLRLSARLHFLDKWQGEELVVKINDEPVWTLAHTHCNKVFATMCRGLNVCGDEKYADRLSHLMSVTINHSAPSVKVSIHSTLDKDPCTASWGVDDVELAVVS